jgi:hypothetical protein
MGDPGQCQLCQYGALRTGIDPRPLTVSGCGGVGALPAYKKSAMLKLRFLCLLSVVPKGRYETKRMCWIVLDVGLIGIYDDLFC